MGRRHRPQLPGVPFHLTARVQGREPLFRDIERFVAARIITASRRCDAAMLAYAVMPNHLHVILLQGRQPLSDFMQPMLRRVALLVQQRTGKEGHVFERRYHASPCLDPDYFRNAVAYVHLNGFRAGLSTGAEEYPWCSHAEYCSMPDRDVANSTDLAIESVLRLFATRDAQTLHDCRNDYRAFLDWRCAMDSHILRESAGEEGVPPERPATIGGDAHWYRNYAAAVLRMAPVAVHAKPDLRDIARGVLTDLAPEMDLELLRSGERGKALIRVRRRFILRAIGAGHRSGIIARFLHVAPTTVSLAITTAKNEGR